MKTLSFTAQQMVYALRQAEAGTLVSDVCRNVGMSEQTFFRWKKTFAGLGVAEVRRLRQLEEENHNRKQLVADLTIDTHMLQEVVQKTL
jgi:putative transposase